MGDVERELRTLTPRGPSAAVRAGTLAAVDRALATAAAPAARPRQAPTPARRAAWVVAVGLVVGVALNGWQSHRHGQRLAELYGPERIPRPIAEVVEMVAQFDEASADQLERNLLAAHRRRPNWDYWGYLEEHLTENEPLWGSLSYEPSETPVEVDGDRPGGVGGGPLDRQRGLRLADRYCA